MEFNRYQMLSLHLSLTSKENVGLVTACPLDSSFVHLESVSICSIESDTLFSLLPTLSSLPRLFSLSIRLSYELHALTKVYESVLRLPKLKFFKLSSLEYRNHLEPLSLPMASSQSLSPIEHLVIEHPFSSTDLSAILSYTPHLSRLKLMHELNINEHLPIISPMVISNLTYLSMDIFKLSFDQFERIISQPYSKLKTLRLLCKDRNYLDAHRWENLVLKYLPRLERFYLKCFDFDFYDKNWPLVKYPGETNEFCSSFLD